MSIVDVAFRTVSCNSCDRTVTFDAQDKDAIKGAVDDNPWLKTARVVQQLFGGRNFVFCSDECTLKAIEKNLLNPEEPKKVIAMPGGASAIAAAAEAAKRQEQATAALKSGAGVTLSNG